MQRESELNEGFLYCRGPAWDKSSYNINRHPGIDSNFRSIYSTSLRTGSTSSNFGSLSNMSTFRASRNNSLSHTNNARRSRVAAVFLVMFMLFVVVGVAVGITLSYVKQRDIIRLHVTFSVDNNGTNNSQEDDILFCSKVQKALHSTKFRHHFLECKSLDTRQIPAVVHHSYIVDFVGDRDTEDVEELKRIVINAIKESTPKRVGVQNLYLAEQGTHQFAFSLPLDTFEGSTPVEKSINQSTLGETTAYVQNTAKRQIVTVAVTKRTETSVKGMELLSPRIEQERTVIALTTATPTILSSQKENTLRPEQKIQTIELNDEKEHEIKRKLPNVKMLQKIQTISKVNTVEEIQTTPTVKTVEEVRATPEVKKVEEIRATPIVKTLGEIRTTPKLTRQEDIHTTSNVKMAEGVRTKPKETMVKEIQTSTKVKTTSSTITIEKVQTKTPDVKTLGKNPWNRLLSGMNFDLEWLE